MTFSRRQFFKTSTGAALAIPLMASLDIDPCEAATGVNYDLSMANPEGAIRLNFNENALGPSPLAVEGAKAGLAEGARYALGGLLKPLIGEHLGIDKDWILMGTGSTELQRLAPISHLQGGGNVVSGYETWGGGLVVADNMGADVKRIPLIKDNGYSFDIDRMLAAVDADTKIFLIVSPNNPTGATAPYAQLKRVADSLPKDVLFVIDEAYADYLPDSFKTGLDLIKEGYSNVLVTRTFSKAHAMAGLRSGYGVAHPDIL
ncbi:MAG: aminotransferase class I/II-fold pyridoxal phosphate-dependent enzyme, partial [Kordiimonadaceae bacterium]|nr:aminotransferase class I/II-fold pyridoxal phosphate-dependent enzyme [Kordiimonadaceae bacterium]